MASHSIPPRLRRAGQEESWVEISSQPSSSSLSSVNEETVNHGHHNLIRRRRLSRPTSQAHPNSLLRHDTASSQEEYEESESESDRIMSSSNEGGIEFNSNATQARARGAPTFITPRSGYVSSDNEDGNRTAINYPIHRSDPNACFTPQPNAFNRLNSSSDARHQSVPGSYFPASRSPPRQQTRLHSSAQNNLPISNLPSTYNTALQHDEALRNSLNTLLSCAAAARGLPKPAMEPVTPAAKTDQSMSNYARGEALASRIMTRPTHSTAPSSPAVLHEPAFHPTLRRLSTSTSASSHGNKRGVPQTRTRSVSRERRLGKKLRQSTSTEDLQNVSPTLLTWVVSAGVVVFLSALSFTVGYQMGKEVGKLEASEVLALTSSGSGDDKLLSCAREVGRSGLGLRRTLASSAIQV